MGWALITGGGTDGRYAIELDYGDAGKQALIVAYQQLLVVISSQILAQQVVVDGYDAQEAALRASLATTIEDIVTAQGVNDAAVGLALQVYENGLRLLNTVQATALPARQALTALRAKQTSTTVALRQVENVRTLDARNAWCCDFTETAAGYVATVDIPGETELILIAPGGRPWDAGDGTISIADKNAALARLTAQAAPKQADKDAAQAAVDAANITLNALQVTADAAQAAYIATPNSATYTAHTLASQALADKQRDVARLNAELVTATKILDLILEQIAIWQAKSASANPNRGDGILTARELMSPAQAFFNAAVLPGWQIKYATYRWGTLTAIDWDAGTGNVTLADAYSSAQGLPVNDVSTLANVPFQYMQSDERAFNNDSRVIVDLRQGWDDPQIIGFLDNPRPDPPTFSETLTIPTLTFSEGTFSSVDLSDYWTGGADPLDYSFEQGSAPAGLSLDPATCILSGTASGGTSSTECVLRCADTFYDDAKNRRYDDSNTFHIDVGGAWDFIDADLGFVDVLDLLQEDVTATVLISGDDPGSVSADPLLNIVCTTTGTNTYGTSAGGFVDGDGGAEIWATSPGGAPALAPTMYYRLLYSGGAFETIGGISTGGFYLDEGVLNTWTVNSLFRVMMRGYDDLTPGVVRYEKSGTLTIEAATDALGANIVSTLSVDFRIALQVTN